MHEDDKLMDKVKDGLEKTGDMMKEGFEKAKDFAHEGMENVKEKFKEGAHKLSEMKDDAFNATKNAGESLNEQLCESLDGTDDDNKMKIQEEFCKRKSDDTDEENIIVEEECEEYNEILPEGDREVA